MKKKRTKKAPRQLVGGGPKTETERLKKTKIRVIGVGGGGGNIISEIASRVKRASFVAANTDLQALKEVSRKVSRFSFGQNFTKGLGTGMNPEIGKEAALNEKDKIKKLLEGQDLCILVVSLGGGTGSGAAPIFAKVARNLGLITYGIFTLPFKFEGEKKLEIAKEALKKLRPNLNALSVIPNERIFQVVDKDTSLNKSLSAINKNLAESLEGLIETIFLPGLINIDFADVKTILEGQGRFAYLNTAEIPGVNQGTEDIKKIISNPLYPYTIRGAKGILFNIVGEKKLGLSEVSQISKTISELTNPEAKIIFGISQSEKHQDKIKVTLLATGCQVKIGIFQEERTTLQPKKRKRRNKKTLLPKKEKKTPLSQKPIIQPKKKTAFKVAKKTRQPKPKIKIKVSEKTKEKLKKAPESPSSQPEAESEKTFAPNLSEVKIRKNALQIKREMEESEKELLEKEKFWETPAFLRRKRIQI